ncbi:MAG: hypothetical protein PHF51_04215 [Candidatus ainarchaeum sp.]|nr:hypothetical protein [Candidatus ainarchaeum sp.]
MPEKRAKAEAGAKLFECRPPKERYELPREPEERMRLLLPAGAAVAILMAALVLFNLLFMNGSPESRCERAALGEWRSSCWNSLARDTGNAAYCDRIDDGVLKDDCITKLGMADNASITFSTCGKLSQAVLRDSCYETLAEMTGSAEGCPLMRNEIYAAQCFSEAALASDDPSLCAHLYSNESIQDCRNKVFASIAVKRRDPGICENITYPDPSVIQAVVDNCVLSVASSANDTSMCARIGDAALRAQCEGQSSLADCGSVSDQAARNLCWFTAAVIDSDAGKCARIEGEGTRDSCYYQIAERTFNASLCGAISDPNLKTVCGNALGSR